MGRGIVTCIWRTFLTAVTGGRKFELALSPVKTWAKYVSLSVSHECMHSIVTAMHALVPYLLGVPTG